MKSYSCLTLLCSCAFLLTNCPAATPAPQPPSKGFTIHGNPKMVDVNILYGLSPKTNGDVINAGGHHTISQRRIDNPEAATDGDHSSGSDEASCTTIIAGRETGGNKNGFDTWKPVYVEYNFGKEKTVKEVLIYRGYDPNKISVAYKVKVELSQTADFAAPIVIFPEQNYREEKESDGRTAKPQVITLDAPVSAQYIRIWQQGYNWNGGAPNGYSNKVRFNEIIVTATVPESEAPPTGPADDVPSQEGLYNIAYRKLPYVYGLAPSNIEAISDGKTDETDGTYAVHNGKGKQWLQFEFKYAYTVKNIKFKLAPGTYQSVKVFVSKQPWEAGELVFSQNNFVGGTMTEIPLGSGEKGKTVRFTVNKAHDQPAEYSEIEIWATEPRKNERRPDYDPATLESVYNTLVWSDEFDDTQVDESKWRIIDGMANHGAIYTKKAVSIKKEGTDSYLSIRSKNWETTENLKRNVYWENYNNQILGSHVTWESGRIESKDTFSFQFGRVAVRAKVNDSKGIWPAIWMLAQDETGHDEIDILEYLGNETGVWDAWTTNHYGIVGKYNNGTKASDGKPNKYWEAWSQNFHVYEVEWDPNYIIWYIDGKQVHSTDRAKGEPLDAMHTRPFFPILETQVGAGWVGHVDYTKQKTKQDSEYLIDWIRIYQKPDSTVTRFDDLESLDYKDNGYYIGVKSHTDGLDLITDTTVQGASMEEHVNKHNFFYEGQPRYEANRLAVKDGVNTPQSIIYELPGVKDVHLTTYYKVSGSNSIRDDSLNFKIECSPDNRTWTDTQLRITDCYVEIGHHNFVHDKQKYARHIFDAYNLPDGTQFVKITFPDYNSGSKTDIQLAKVTFQQKK